MAAFVRWARSRPEVAQGHFTGSTVAKTLKRVDYKDLENLARLRATPRGAQEASAVTMH